jgi:hypothetical protein
MVHTELPEIHATLLPLGRLDGPGFASGAWCNRTRSTLRVITGHEEVSEGDILISRANVTRCGTGLVFQNYITRCSGI